MIGLPQQGQKIKVWPDPKLKVQASETPISDGGRWLKADGERVLWNLFRHRQLLAGEIHLHDPRPGAEESPEAMSTLARDVEVAQRRAKLADEKKDEAKERQLQAQ
jgi:hypothetical protein